MHRTESGTVRWLLAPALVLLGIGIGWILRGHGEIPSRDGPAPTPALTPDEEDAAPVLAGRAAAPMRPGLRAAGRAGPRPAADVAPARDQTDLRGGLLAITLDVPDGWPKLSGYAYALPAGADGVATVERAPHARIWNSACDAIRLPAAGSWDVFFTAGWTAGAALDVEVAPDATVRVRLAPHASAPIRFDLEGDLPADLAEDLRSGVRVSTPSTAGNVRFPGRRARPTLGQWADFDAQGTALTHPLPTGRSYEVSPGFLKGREGRAARHFHPGSCRLVPERSLVSAGDTVSVRVVRRGALRIRIGTDRAPPDSWAVWTPVVRLELHVAGGEGGHTWARLRPEGNATGTPHRVLWGDSGTARLTWGGAGIVAGARDGIRLEAGTETRVDVLLELDPAFSLREASRTRREALVRVEVEVEGWTETREDAELVLFGPRPDDQIDLYYPRQSTFHLDSFKPERAWAVRCPDLASDVAEISPDGVLRLVMKPAGYLLVAPDWVAPACSGALVLERADGTPFPVCTAETDDAPPGVRDIGPRVAVRAGWLVGPLTAGEHRFRVSLGGVRLPDVLGRVEPGRIQVLPIVR